MNIKRLFVCEEPHNNWYEYIYSYHNKNSPHNSQHMFDIYSLTHILASCVITYIFRKLQYDNKQYNIIVSVLLLKIIFEIYENTPKQISRYNRVEVNSAGGSSYYGDSIINVAGDMISSIIGIYIGYQPDYVVFSAILLLYVIITFRLGMNVWYDFFYFMFN